VKLPIILRLPGIPVFRIEDEAEELGGKPILVVLRAAWRDRMARTFAGNGFGRMLSSWTRSVNRSGIPAFACPAPVLAVRVV